MYGKTGFNEAGGFLPRKPAPQELDPSWTSVGFNEAGGFLPRKLSTIAGDGKKLY